MSVPERLNVVLIPRAAAVLREMQESSGHSKTDIVNRALQMMQFFLREKEEGAQISIKKEGEPEMTVEFL